MDNILFQRHIIEERSYVSFVKREIHNVLRLVFNEQRTGEIDIVVSEMVSNIIKHAHRGELLYRLSNEGDLPVFEVIGIDNGPGISDVSHAMKDGISTKNTLGQGLGSIMRLSNTAQLYSQQAWGTIVYAKLYADPAYQPVNRNVIVRCLNVAKPGEKVSGDGIAVRLLKDKTLVLAGDGLGHGPYAKEAVDKAIVTFMDCMYADPSEILRTLDRSVKKTRGLVASVAVLDHQLKQWSICGIGNIYARLQKGLEFKNYIGNNGIIGLNIPQRIENAAYPMEKLQQLILCSDGIRTKWDLVRYPGILKYDPMILAAILYKDHARQSDDMTILTVKVI